MGKSVANPQPSYDELRAITDAVYGGKIEKTAAFKGAYIILDKYGIRLRDKNGQAPVRRRNNARGI